jgi:hypothetical protein
MAKKDLLIAIEHDGVREVHATDWTGNYATACGLDGGIDGYSPMDGQRPTPLGKDRKITCPDCKAIFMHMRQYRATDFEDPANA